MSDDDARETKLPAWVQNTIRELRRDLSMALADLEEARETAKVARLDSGAETAVATFTGPDGEEIGIPAGEEDLTITFAKRGLMITCTEDGISVEALIGLLMTPKSKTDVWLENETEWEE